MVATSDGRLRDRGRREDEKKKKKKNTSWGMSGSGHLAYRRAPSLELSCQLLKILFHRQIPIRIEEINTTDFLQR